MGGGGGWIPNVLGGKNPGGGKEIIRDPIVQLNYAMYCI